MINKIKYEDHNLTEMEIIDWNEAIERINNQEPMTVIEVKDGMATCKFINDPDGKCFLLPVDSLTIKE